MPVKFKSKSEYDSMFPWRESIKSSAYVPDPDQAAIPAGLKSEQIGVVQEPPLQRKKRPDQFPDHSPYFRDEPKSDDYILIGDQSKFAPSIKYKTSGPITEKRTAVSAIRDQQNEPKSDRTPPPAPRIEKSPVRPAPKVLVNPGGPQNGNYQTGKDGKLKGNIQEPKYDRKPPPPAHRMGRPPVRPAPKVVVNPGGPQAGKNGILKGKHSDAKENRPPPAPRGHLDHGGSKQKPYHENYPPKKSAMNPTKIRDRQQNGYNEPIHSQPKVSKGEPVRRQREEKVLPEPARSAPAAEKTIPDDYAMKYKAGVAPPRPLGPKRLTEYQMQYKWRNASKSSPLLAAESVVYNSNPQVAPFKSDNISRKSEYKARFGEYDVQPLEQLDQQSNGEAKRSAMKRSKSMSAISPDKLNAAGAGRAITSDNKRLLKESVNPLRLHFPHGKQRSYNSEYSANFKSPTNFAYEGGAWKGADPPHLELQDDTVTKPEQDDELSETRANWYAEVVELRNKAQEYKKRAHGTHFGREHLAQLMARQTEMWDTVSNSSTLSALSLEPAGKKSAKASEVSSKKETLGSRKKLAKAKEAWSVPENYSYPDSERTLSPRSGSPRLDSEIGSIPSPEDEIVSASLSSKDEQEGRIPTPILKSVPSTFKPRHHLDRTTPAVGGALLTSPPRRGTSSSTRSSVDPRYKADDDEYLLSREQQREHHSYSPRSSQVAFSESDDNDWSNRATQKQKSTPPKSSQKPGGLDASPTFGMPTRDTHVLVDEDASIDRPLATDYVHSPEKRASARKLEFQRKYPNVNIPATLRETLREDMHTPNSYEVSLDDIPRREPDEDVLSFSARSVASSISIASEVLRRAERNREEFWGSDGNRRVQRNGSHFS